MDDEDFYDEFGNYIGPEETSYAQMDGPRGRSPSPLRYDQPEAMEVEHQPTTAPSDDFVSHSQQIVLHEDKVYYPSASEVYGQDVETLVQEEDTQPITQPIIEPVQVKSFELTEEGLPTTIYTKEYLHQMSKYPVNRRNVALVGHLHHGKTALIDCLVMQTHQFDANDLAAAKTKTGPKEPKLTRYTDLHQLERDRGLSLKAQPISLLLPDMRGKNYFFNVMDTPGHVDFIGEVAASCRLADGAVVVIDAVEGLMMNTERVLKHLVQEQIPFTVLINKMDRLIVELKMPPADAYHKLKHTLDEVNTYISTLTPDWESIRVSPELGNVCFSSTEYGFVFSLRSIAQLYMDTWGKAMDLEELARRLWGDVYYNSETRGFRRKPLDSSTKRTFVHFVLEPLYKIFSHVLSQEGKQLKKLIKELGMGGRINVSDFDEDVRPLLRRVLMEFYGDFAPLVDMCVRHLPNPAEASAKKAELYYTGPLDSLVGQSIKACHSDGPLVIQIAKLYPTADRSHFDAFGRIMSGRVTKGMRIRVLGESFSLEDDEDMSIQEISHVWMYCTRYRIEVPSLDAGNWVLLRGVDETIAKTATIVSMKFPRDEDAHVFRPLRFPIEPVFKVAVEPLNPGELPKMLDGLRKITKSYPLVVTKVEESGEHILLGTGELHLDSVMYDLRTMYAEIEIRISDPAVKFCETVVETSSLQCFAETPNKKNKMTFIAEPLETEIGADIETRKVDINGDRKTLERHFEQNYKWDILASRGIWAFGPDDHSSNILIDDTLPDEVDKKLLYSVKDSIVQGFRWGTREGPLCEEQIRNVKFKVLDAVLAPEPIYRGGGQIIPTARRVTYSSFLMATPRLMEPVYSVEIQTSQDAIPAVYAVLTRRRGHPVQDVPKAGTPFYTVKAFIPLIDSFGFETDLRTHTQGQAFCQLVFDHYQVVPGDPLDRDIQLRQLEPSPAPHLARDFMLKTRRRKGLSEDVSISKFFDDPMLLELAKQDVLMGTNLL